MNKESIPVPKPLTDDDFVDIPPAWGGDTGCIPEDGSIAAIYSRVKQFVKNNPIKIILPNKDVL